MLRNKTQNVPLELDEFDVEYEVRPTEDSRDYWAATYEFTVKVKHPTLSQRLSKTYRFGDLFYLLICSKPFYDNPDLEIVTAHDLSKAVIQQTLETEKIRRYVETKIGEAAGSSAKEAFDWLSKMFVTEYDP